MRVLGYLDYQGFEQFLNAVPRKFRFVSPLTFSYFLHTLAMFECNDLSRLEPLFASVEFYAPTAPVDMCCRIVWYILILFPHVVKIVSISILLVCSDLV